MILRYCLECEYHEKISLDGNEHSRCHKENCLSLYSDCVINAAIRKFVGDNEFDILKKPKSALETCYPLA